MLMKDNCLAYFFIIKYRSIIQCIAGYYCYIPRENINVGENIDMPAFMFSKLFHKCL